MDFASPSEGPKSRATRTDFAPNAEGRQLSKLFGGSLGPAALVDEPDEEAKQPKYDPEQDAHQPAQVRADGDFADVQQTSNDDTCDANGGEEKTGNRVVLPAIRGGVRPGLKDGLDFRQRCGQLWIALKFVQEGKLDAIVEPRTK